MPIRLYSGVEGAGKSCMMTKDLYLHHLSGGTVLAFPGYELYGYDADTGERITLSETLLPEQWVNLPDELKRRKIAIGIDEIGNFFNHHSWYNKINDMLYAMLAQRRKFEVAVMATGPFIEDMPPDIRKMFHEIVHCSDNHTLNHAISRGTRCVYYKEDRRGLLSRPTQRFTRKKVFMMKDWYKHYDTYAAVDAIHQFIKVKFKGREIIIGPDGEIQSGGGSGGSFDQAGADRMLGQIQAKSNDTRRSEVEKALRYFVDKGITSVEAKTISQILPGYSMTGTNGLGSILREYGVTYKGHKRAYDLSGVNIS